MAPLRVLVALSAVVLAASEDCVWNKDTDYPDEPPLILDDNLKLVLPVMKDTTREVRIPSGSIVTLACPGTRNSLARLGKVVVEATCVGGVMLDVNEEKMPLSTLGCSKTIRSTIKKNLGSCGAGDLGQLHIIGFQFADRFYEQILVCFDHDKQTTLYTRHVLHGANIEGKDSDSSRPAFKTSRGFFNVSMSKLYTQNSQFELLKTLLGDEELANTMFDTSKYYFAKGHLSPDADFVTLTEQDATYYYINAVPQWQAFNNGNWKFLEYATRDLAQQKGRDLRVYNGGWGVLELDDNNGNPVKVFLGLVENETVVPAPAVTWKVVHDEYSNCAVAVVGVNNPHLTSAPSTTLCEDVCSSLSWIDFDVSDLTNGYMYCCSVSDLRAAVPHVPDIGDVCLLTLKGPGC
nr:duplex-specific nuclease [Austinograea rodriguezensis]